MLRALELHEMGELQRREHDSELWTGDAAPPVLAGLVMEREALYARIDARVDGWSATAPARRCAGPTPLVPRGRHGLLSGSNSFNEGTSKR